MTPWIALTLWSAMVATLLHSGTAVSRTPGYVAERSAFSRNRLVTGLLATLASAPLVFLLTVRQDVGTDFASYVEMYERFRAGEALPWIEPLYAALNRMAAPFGPSGVVIVFAASGALAALPLFYRVFRSSPTPWLGILILFGLSFPFLMTNTIRSAVAIGIVMLILPTIWRRQFVTWSLGILLASGFHFTALLVWPLYYFLHMAWPKVLAWCGLIFSIIISTNREIGVSFVQWTPTILPSKYSHYADLVLERLTTYQFGFGYLIYISLAGLVLVGWDRARGEGPETLVFRNSAMLGLIMAIALYQLWAVNRLGFYFMPSLAVFLPWIISRCVTAAEKPLWTAGLTMLFLLLLGRGLSGAAHHAVPYHWIF